MSTNIFHTVHVVTEEVLRDISPAKGQGKIVMGANNRLNRVQFCTWNSDHVCTYFDYTIDECYAILVRNDITTLFVSSR